MANPFLVLGGIAISVAAAAFGILQVPGWVASAQDAAATQDLANISLAQAASISQSGAYAHNFADLEDGESGVKLSLSGGVLPVDIRGNDKVWCAVVEAATGTFHAASSTRSGSARGEDALSAASAAGCPNSMLPLTGASWTIKCDTDVTNFALPIGVAAGTAEWSDGVTQTFTYTPTERALAANTEYTVTFNGTFSRLAVPTSNGKAAARACIRSMDAWAGNTRTTSMYTAFANLPNLTSVPEEIPPGITDLERAFHNTQFNGDISRWDTSQVTNFSDMFFNNNVFNHPIGGWKTGEVTDMGSMFFNAHAFDQPIGGWDVRKVADMSSMFSRAEAFNQDISGWKTDSLTNMRSMFSSATVFNQDISGWDISEVTSLVETFSYAKAFNQDISGWKTGKVTTLAHTFYSAAAFNQNINNWDTRKVESMAGTFKYARAFNQPLDRWDLVNVTTTSEMFEQANVFNQPIGGWNVGGVENMSRMFHGARAFQQPLASWDTSSVTDMWSMFNSSFYNLDLSAWDVGLVTSYADFGGMPAAHWPAFK